MVKSLSVRLKSEAALTSTRVAPLNVNALLSAAGGTLEDGLAPNITISPASPKSEGFLPRAASW